MSLTAKAPAWLTYIALIASLGLVALSGIVVAIGFDADDTTSAVMFVGVVVLALWFVVLLCGDTQSAGAEGGAFLALLGFLVGSVLTLFEDLTDAFQGKAAPLSLSQAICWAMGVAIFVIGMLVARRR